MTNAYFSTGVTGVYCPVGGCAAVVVQEGGSPCTSQTDALNIQNFGAKSIAGVVLTGGSMYGLHGASLGAFKCVTSMIKDEDYKFLRLGGFKLPHISSAAILDLLVQERLSQAGESKYHQLTPDLILSEYQRMGEATCRRALGHDHESAPLRSGNFGAGTAAAVWNAQLEANQTTRGGLGSASIRLRDGIIVGAVIAVNVFGVIGDEERAIFRLNGSEAQESWIRDSGSSHTAIGAVATNLVMTREALRKATQMAFQGIVQAVFPAASVYDGDTLFGLSTNRLNLTDSHERVSLVGSAMRQAVFISVYRAVCCGTWRSRMPAAVTEDKCQKVLGAEYLLECKLSGAHDLLPCDKTYGF